MTEPRVGIDTLRERLDQSLSGSYRIEREIGGGGMSRVFLAEETALGRRVVVKVLSPDLAHELSAERFAREIRLSARLQHPNIVPVLTAGTAANLPYYTMPFIDGESLRGRLKRAAHGERVPLAHAIDILRDVARALAYAHSVGVVHRDIKPENVLLGYDSAVVADFGVAKALAAARTQGASSSAITLTQGGIALGTPAYMSPEQAAGDPTVDHRADLYAWGVVAYEVLSGKHPFADRQSIQALVTAHLVENARALTDVAPHVPPPVSGLVMQCLAKNSDHRPSNAREIVETLDGAVTPSGVARPASPRAVVVTRRRTRTAVAIALGIVAIGGAAAISHGLRRTPTTTSPATGRSLESSPGYDAYVRGKVIASNENREDNNAAIALLRQAVAADPSLAVAHATLARALAIKTFYYAADSEKKRLNEDAEVAVAKALQLDPNLAYAHLVRGFMLWTPNKRFPHEQAINAYRRALALDPKLDEAHHQLALVYLHLGLFDAAKARIDSALAINPGNTIARFRYGVIDLYRGQYERAYSVFNSTPLEGNPSLWAFQMSTVLFRLGREGEATVLIDKFLRDYPNDEGGVGNSVRAMMLAKAGRRSEADSAIARSIRLGRTFGHFHHTTYNIASAYALLGDRASAIQWLQTTADDGFPCYPLFANDAQLDGLRTDPAFIALMARLKADWEERKRTL